MTDSDEKDITEVDIPDDVSSIEDLESIDGIDVEREYWTDYTLQHHGIIFCWRNNLKQVLLAVEESISDISDNFDIVLLNASGDFITKLESVENEEEALRAALKYQHQYPQGEFPQLEEDSVDRSSDFVPLTQSGAEQTEEMQGKSEEELEEMIESAEDESKKSVLQRLKTILYMD